MSSRAVSTEHPSPAGWLPRVIAIPTPPVVHPIEAVRPWRSMTSCLHGLPRFARNDNQRAWTAASRFAPRSDETTAYGPYAVLVTRNHGHSPAGAPATHAGWWIGRPGVGPIRRCHRACVSITALMSTSRCASSARRRAWARERMHGPPALPNMLADRLLKACHSLVAAGTGSRVGFVWRYTGAVGSEHDFVRRCLSPARPSS